ncbi:MAG TPA: rhodanese-like domain-containing protein [Oscillatoriaceae cyanobacterium M33_DOE_052]|uniref:DUF2892 domain-containing protein n=1 Tax=Planktothricoides sp. SpSt-374 TaxID=2282167 RepID=A0A7C3ZPY7_9CYAN|nr:rhodanese-like domain-containing protein [Oscillatoriaceae cyanobacterium M33_DOE_052]
MTLSLEPKIRDIDATTLKQWLDSQKVLLVDVREPAEYAGEHIPGAQLMALSGFDPAKLPQEGSKKLVLHCQSGRRSSRAAQLVIEAGFPEVTQLQGGLTAWKAAGYPTLINKKAPISLMRQVQIVAGSLVFIGTILGAFVSPGFLILSGFVGCGLVFAGVTDTCMMAQLLAKLPYNQVKN